MLLALTEFLQNYYSWLRVFHYITFRSILAVLSALLVALMIGPCVIRRLEALKVKQFVRQDGPKSHYDKMGTPTMGGGVILASILFSVLLCGNLKQSCVWVVLFVTIGFGIVGYADDYLKLIRGSDKGLTARAKFLSQALLAICVMFYLYHTTSSATATQLIMPFFKQFIWDLGPWFLLFGFLVIVGTSNAVNLTDGLDGLAIMPTVLVAGGLGIFAYVAGNVIYAKYLGIPYIAGVGELTVYCGALVGAGLGFLWFNTYPAQVFMGDVGSLSLGATLGVIAVLVRQELVLFIMGGVFVLETLSVIAQVGSFKMTGHRVFRMAPLHHHFELLGWAEPKIIVRFWIISLIFVLIGLASLKLR